MSGGAPLSSWLIAPTLVHSHDAPAGYAELAQ
jgi:hypothetical protein